MPLLGSDGWRFSDLSVPWRCDAPMKKSFADMVRSLGLMAVIVAALLFIGART